MHHDLSQPAHAMHHMHLWYDRPSRTEACLPSPQGEASYYMPQATNPSVHARQKLAYHPLGERPNLIIHPARRHGGLPTIPARRGLSS